MDLKNFVQKRDRAASPNDHKNGQSYKEDRRAIAANAKVTLRKMHPSVAQQTHRLQMSSGLPSRGFGNTQNTSATVQHDSQGRQDSHLHQPDAFDTDAESLDTTIDQSVIQAEPDQVKHVSEQQRGDIVDLDSDGRTNEDDEDGESEIVYEEFDYENYVLRPEDHGFLRQRGQQHLTHEQAIEFLLEHRPESFRTVKGDSYPSTTDGNPTEWNGKVEPNSEAFDDGDLASPVLHDQGLHVHDPMTPPSMHRGLDGERAERYDRQSNKLFKQSAHLRDQQRSSGLTGAPMQSSQPPSYSQANQALVLSQRLNPPFTRPVQRHDQSVQPPQGQFQGVAQPLNAGRSAAPAQRPSSARNKVVPVIQHQVVDPVQLQNNNASPQGDYDFDALKEMGYNELKRESFDHNPRAPLQLLSDDMQQKPLTERLDHVQHNFDAGKQSQFFSALPTAEWEDAGDWFLDKFNSIIQRTKDARQKKRKLAQGFEGQIEKRHEHVSKKMRQVEDAMTKMQAQGEGLVPRSPRPSKSPQPKKR